MRPEPEKVIKTLLVEISRQFYFNRRSVRKAEEEETTKDILEMWDVQGLWNQRKAESRKEKRSECKMKF